MARSFYDNHGCYKGRARRRVGRPPAEMPDGDADDVCKWGRRRRDIESSFHVDNMTQRKWVEVILQKLLARGIALALDELPRRDVSREFLTL